jgi:hypothetical protein
MSTAPIDDKVAPAQIAAIGEWGTVKGERFAYLKNIEQPTLNTFEVARATFQDSAGLF